MMPDRKPERADAGSMMHRLPPSETRADERSATPLGFAYAVVFGERTARQRKMDSSMTDARTFRARIRIAREQGRGGITLGLIEAEKLPS